MTRINATFMTRADLVLAMHQGPGGSGSALVALAGEGISKIVDGRYDILGFDPR